MDVDNNNYNCLTRNTAILLGFRYLILLHCKQCCGAATFLGGAQASELTPAPTKLS